MEEPAPTKVTIKIDQIGDYDHYKKKFINLSLRDLKVELSSEISLFVRDL